MELKQLFAAIGFGLVATTVSAFTVTVGGTTVAGQGQTTSLAGATVVTFNSSLNNPFGYVGGAVKNGSSSSNWASPPGDTSNFYTVGPGTGQSSPGTVTLGSLSRYFGYFGGSPDTYNSIELYKGTTWLATFSGIFLAAAVPVSPDGNWNTGAYWNIWADNASEHFNIVKFVSSTNAFETDNHASIAAIPEPGTYAMMLAGLGLMALVARRRKSGIHG
jgi:hypothetical protein